MRGAKLHITAASLVHELVVMPTKGMRQDETDYAVSFSIPVNTPGVTIINRSFAPPELNAFDYPASGHHSMPEGFVVFDDVFVPWDRVFLAGEVQLASRLAQALGLWERTGGLVGSVGTSRLFVGLAQLVTEMQGKERDAICQNTIAELICYAEMLRMSLDYRLQPLRDDAARDGPPQRARDERGQVLLRGQLPRRGEEAARPGRRPGADAAARRPTCATRRRAATSASTCTPSPSVDVETRMRVYNLIRDLTADAYGGWHLVVALQAGGGLSAQRIMMNRIYDMPGAKAAALAAAGVPAALPLAAE